MYPVPLFPGMPGGMELAILLILFVPLFGVGLLVFGLVVLLSSGSDESDDEEGDDGDGTADWVD